jgi:hypothetical protein
VTPGPGTYTLPSDFGIYQAQEKYMAETERLEKLKSKRLNLLSSQGRNKGKLGIGLGGAQSLRTSTAQKAIPKDLTVET